MVKVQVPAPQRTCNILKVLMNCRKQSKKEIEDQAWGPCCKEMNSRRKAKESCEQRRLKKTLCQPCPLVQTLGKCQPTCQNEHSMEISSLMNPCLSDRMRDGEGEKNPDKSIGSDLKACCPRHRYSPEDVGVSACLEGVNGRVRYHTPPTDTSTAM